MALTSPALSRVRKGDLCSGCGLCAAISDGKIEMEVSDGGFLRPRQLAPLSGEEDRLVSETCPGLRLTQPVSEGSTDHTLWGPVVQVRSGHAVDPEMRRNASSGGALSALLVYLLEKNEIDYVVQTTADAGFPVGNVTVKSFGRDEVFDAAGSRYAPSAPLASLESHLCDEGRFAFVGKPCDVAALRAMSRFDSRIERKIPYVFSFFCAGVPSLNGAREVLGRLGVEEGELQNFRYRGDGWPGFATAVSRDGRVARMSYADSWGGILSRHVQFRCKICPDGTGGAADIVCADAWICDDKGYPLFEEEEGWSLIVSRNRHGEDLLQRAMDDGAIVASQTDIDGIENMQPGQVKRKGLALSRIAAMAVTLKPVPRFAGFNLAKAARKPGIWQNVRSFLGTIRRIVLPGRK